MSYHDHVYTRGYLLANKEIPEAPQRWIRIPHLPDPWKLYVDPLLHYYRASQKESSVFAIGFFTSLRFPGEGPEKLTQRIASTLCQSQESFQSLIDSLQGHFAIFSFINDRVTVQSDAMAICPLFYYKGCGDLRCVSSHVRLTATAAKANPNLFSQPGYYKKNGSDQNFADTTSYQDVYRVPANLELDLSNQKVRRIYPRKQIKPWKVKDCALFLQKATANHLNVLLSESSPYSRVLVSITGGIDTRANLSLIKKYIPKLEFFTFDPPTVNQYSRHDLETVKTILELEGITNHKFIRSSKESVDPSLERILRSNTEFGYSSQVAQALFKTYGQQSATLHLRSSGYEIGRGYYRRSGYKKSNRTVDAAYCAYIMCQQHSVSAEVLDAYKNYWEETNCSCIAELGYDPLDLLVWEHRMSVWHSTIVQEHALTFESSVLINSRDLWNALISVAPRQRRHYKVFTSLIKANCPALRKIPVNGQPLVPSFKSHLYRLRKSLASK
ncbi:MAG: hypothetical protein Q4Q13_00800 [Vagococcus sp.]|nr:hypothetical protein [Vagococcus sp.]